MDSPGALFTAASRIRNAPVGDKIVIQATNLVFADPLGVSLLGTSIQSAREKNSSVSISGLNSNISSYLDRVNLFNGINLIDCDHRKKINRRDQSASMVELTQVTCPAEVDSASNSLAVSLLGKLGLDPHAPLDDMTCSNAYEDVLGNIRYALSELLENALTHARRNGFDTASVWVASQYYPKPQSFRLGIVDNGCGFLGSLRNHEGLTEKTHMAATMLAIEPFISCNRELGVNGVDSVNQGVGLTTTRNIIREAGGDMLLTSGNCFHLLRSNRAYTLSNNVTWQGVAIGIVCRRNALSGIRYSDLLPKQPVTASRKRLRFEN